MIYDRTQSDVDAAIVLRDTKVKNFKALTENEILTLEKGTITINTLNRIENKQQELKNAFNSMGYWNTPITNKIWSENDIFNIGDFQRIIENVNILKKAFFEYPNTPNTPTTLYHYNNINSIEKILLDFDFMITVVEGNWEECGTFECGEV